MAEDSTGLTPVTPPSDVVAVPATSAQESLWFLDRLAPGRAAYNIPWAFRGTGHLDVKALESAVNDLVARHEVLRTTFGERDGRPVQVIAPSGVVLVPVVQVPLGENRDADLAALVAEDARAPFDLGKGPLLRARVLSIGPGDFILQLTVHHIVVDGWSLGILFGELSQAYAARLQGRCAELPPLDLQYADFAVWQRSELDAGGFEAGLAFWRTLLAGADEPITLPFDRPRPERASHRGGKVPVALSRSLVASLASVMRAEGVTLFMTLLTALAVLLRRHGAGDPVVIGTPAANRLQTEIEQGVGFFANALALPCDTSGNPTFRECLARVRRTTLTAFDHQDVPFERVVEQVSPLRNLGVNPLFQVMFALQRTSATPLSLAGATLTPLDIDNGTAKFDLLLELQEQPDRVVGSLEFNADIFERTTAERLVHRFTRLLEKVAADPHRQLSDYDVLDAAERARVVDVLPCGPTRPAAVSVVEAFLSRASEQPGSPAIEMGGRTLTYSDLADRSVGLARRLRTVGVGRGHCVGVLFERSFGQIVAILGVLESGAAYVPLDPAYPAERLASMIEQAAIHHVVSDPRLAAQAIDASQVQVLGLDDEGRGVDVDDSGRSTPAAADTPSASSARGADLLPQPTDAVYVLFTSGSTGRPKGVLMPHGAVTNLIAWQTERSGPRPQRTLQFSPIGFDVSFQEIFATLTTGGTLVLVGDETRRDPALLLRHMSDTRVERIFLPFVALQHLAEAADRSAVPLALREIVTAGEQLKVTPALIRLFERLPGCVLDNQYGPTETHVVTAHRLEGAPATWPELPPIGTPIANARVYLVDEHQEPVPEGAVGEIVVGGVPVAHGYVNDEARTSSRFIPSPFVVGDRLYRTGDRARLDAEGRLVFLGRSDDQVKIRGHRVEPAEVEAALAAHASVGACAVVAVDLPAGRALVAYVVPTHGQPIDTQQLRTHVRTTLPDYMVPSTVVVMDALPLTASGKVNRRALPAPATAAPGPQTDRVAPRDSLERDLLGIWQDVLGVGSLGITDDFFALGGHSLAAARLVSAIARRLDRDVPVALLFRAPTIAQMAAAMRTPASEEEHGNVVALNDVSSSALPVFLVHALGGSVFAYRLLAERLHRPVYGVQARLEHGVPRDVDSVSETATRYIAEIRRVHPDGPYVLGGWSAGGTIALEMARQLRTERAHVVLLVEIDSAPYNVGAEARRLELAYWLKLLANVPHWIVDDMKSEGLGSIPLRIVRRLRSYVRKAQAIAAGGNAYAAEVGGFMNTGALATTQKRFAERLYTALRTYRPVPYDGDVLLFQAQVHPLTKLHESDRAWRGLSPRVQIVSLPGNHLSIVKPPQVDVMAASLESTLQRLEHGARTAPQR